MHRLYVLRKHDNNLTYTHLRTQQTFHSLSMNRLHLLQRLIHGIPHLHFNPFLQLIRVCRNVFLLCMPFLHCSLDHSFGNVDTNRPRLLDVGQQWPVEILQRWRSSRQRINSCDQHSVREHSGTGQNGSKANSREASGVVAFR